MRRTLPLTLSVAALAGSLLVGLPPSGAGPAPAETRAAVEQRVPQLRITTVVGGLDNPWDVQQGAGGRLVVSERDDARLSVVRKGGIL